MDKIKMPKWEVEEDIVISGISGRFPESDSIQEFRDHLMNGDDMVTADDRRWPVGIFGLPSRMGKLKDLSKFDATFFGVHAKQANSMDPQMRFLLEVTHEAIIDAGCQPSKLCGRKIGVFVGTCTSETEEGLGQDLEKHSGYLLTGCSRAMLANRVSYSFDFKGPSFTVDTACSSSLMAMDLAIVSIRTGKCEAAIVTGVNLCLKPQTSANFNKLGMLAADGKCKTFDASGSGYVRSEAAVAIFLQKSSEATRVYATVLHSKSNTDGYKEQGITFPVGKMQKKLLEEVYSEASIDPAKVAYVELHGTGTKVGDPQEINSVTDFFCQGRKGPLLVGSVKSNMGHSEAASGLCSVAKVLIAMEEGIIPGNLHYKTPNPEIHGLLSGVLQVVDKNMPWDGGIVGINNFGFGGANVHVILKSNPIPKISCTSPQQEAELKLVPYSGRTEEGVAAVLDLLEKIPNDNTLHNLLVEPALAPYNLHPYRGYTILNSKTPVREITRCAPHARPVWFIYSGQGTQWTGMCRDLMKIDIFRQAILRADETLKPFNISIRKMLESDVEGIFDDVLNSCIGIITTQVALTNVLKQLEIVPDGVIGHSVGELGCSYADGCFTEEQAVLTAYWRGRLIKESKLPPGAMAAVGLTWEEAKQKCPEGVVPACHNAKTTVTVSGAAPLISEFVKTMKSEGKFAKEVNSSGIAFHSHFMSPIGPKFKEALEKFIPNPKPRSSKWISSSIDEAEWNSPLAKLCSAEYHANNLVSPVLFQEALKHVPKDAIVIEIAPHSLLQGILKQSIGNQCISIGLMKKGVQDQVGCFLSSLGKLFNNGINLKAAKMYPQVSHPLPRGTPMISSLITWDHSQSWDVATAQHFISSGAGGAQLTVEVDISSQESKDYYLIDHKIDGRIVFPATGYLVLAWKALAKFKGKQYNDLKVVLENVTLHRATILPKTGKVKFLVSFMVTGGEFEISEGGATVVTGRIYESESNSLKYSNDVRQGQDKSAEYLKMDSGDIYKELRLRGYDYGPEFQGIVESDNKGFNGKLKWDGNWVSYLDTMLQFSILSLPIRSLYLPTRLQYIHINPEIHQNSINLAKGDGKDDDSKDITALPVVTDNVINVCLSGGIEIKGMKPSLAPRNVAQQRMPVLETYQFVPFIENRCLTRAVGSDVQSLKQYNNVVIQKAKEFIRQSSKFLPSLQFLTDLAKETSVTKNNDQDVDRFLNATTLNASLLKVLTAICKTKLDNDLKINIETTIEQNKTALQDDSLLSAVLHPRIICTCLDLVQENITTRNIKIVEVGAGRGNLFPKFVTLLNSQLLTRVDCTVTDVNPDILNSSDLETYNVKKQKWDVFSEVAPRGADEAHLTFGRGLLSTNASAVETCLTNIATSVKEGGFVILVECTKEWLPIQLLGAIGEQNGRSTTINRETLINTSQKVGLQLIAEKSDDISSTIFLLRKVRDDGNKASVIIIEENRYDQWVDELKQKMKSLQQAETKETLWLVAHDSARNGIVGLTNCLRQEPGGHHIRTIFNPHLDSSSQKLFQTSPVKGLKSLYGDVIKKDLVINVYDGSSWGTYRHIPIDDDSGVEQLETKHAYVNILTRGDMSTLRWIESPVKYFTPKNTNKCLCQVYYAPLNFRDIMLATGKLPPDAIPGALADQDCILGLEFSGRDENGRRVMGLVPAKGMATTVVIDPTFSWTVPDHWTLEDAATVPVVYATVYYALLVRGNLQKGESVLIHSGSGGVGQAAISVALSLGCEVFTTVGSEEKRDYLKKLFPQLKDKNFANSRDTSFEHHILRVTNGKGVNVVLNSLAEDKLMASVRCLAQHGRFLEIGKYDLSNNTPLGMSIFLKNISFHGILLDALFDDSHTDKKLVVDLLSQGIKRGVVKPLHRTVFDKHQLEEAYRYMAAGKHIGKVILKIRDEEKEKLVTPVPLHMSAIPRAVCHPNKVYVIIGGLGGFGLELANWLVGRGALHIVLSTRSGVRTGYQSRLIRLWKEKRINVLVSTSDVSTEDGAKKLLNESSSIGPVGGIFNLAMVLRDAFMENQTVDAFEAVCDPKAKGTYYLDQVSRKLCPELDWFVVFSSVSCGRGNAGQSNYGYANSVMERICEIRKKDGLPALAIQWGAVGDVGIILESGGSNDAVIGGTQPQRITSCLTTLDGFLNQSYPVTSSFIMAEKQSGSTGKKKVNILASIGNILGFKDASSLNPDMSLVELGMDSLMGVEIKNILERDFDIVLSSTEIGQMTVKRLKDLSDNKESSAPVENEKSEVTKVLRFDLQNLVPTECIVNLNKVQSGKPLFVVHPIEGSTLALETLGSKLRCPVYGIQCTADAPLDSVEELASFYIKQIKTVQPEGPYRISGYSFGAAVAFEMALQLQDSGASKGVIERLILLDGSHNIIAAYVEGYHNRTDVKELSEGEADTLCLFTLHFANINYRELKQELLQLTTWESRLQYTSEILMKTGKFTNKEQVTSAAELYYKRLKSSYKYSPVKKYNGEVFLLRARQHPNASEPLPEDYGLKQVCTGAVHVHIVDGDHDTFILDDNADKCAKLISEILSR